jgi:hypothetical protein
MAVENLLGQGQGTAPPKHLLDLFIILGELLVGRDSWV